jgi:PPOX class probable F420-dependent enzyme
VGTPFSGTAVFLVLVTPTPSFAQATPPAAPSRAQVIAAAKDFMRDARFGTLITIGADGQPQARIVDPFLPDSDLTVWIATSPLTRKVHDIRRDPRVTLLYFNPTAYEYVTIIGTAVPDTTALQKAGHWKDEWTALYKDQNRGEDYLLLKVTPTRLEVVSAQRGLGNDPHTWRPVTVDLPR